MSTGKDNKRFLKSRQAGEGHESVETEHRGVDETLGDRTL